MIISIVLILTCVEIIRYYSDTSNNNDSNNVSFCENCPHITQEELDAGWYYGELDQKKPGTPDTWIHILEGTRSAMWIDPILKPYGELKQVFA